MRKLETPWKIVIGFVALYLVAYVLGEIGYASCHGGPCSSSITLSLFREVSLILKLFSVAIGLPLSLVFGVVAIATRFLKK